MASAPPPDDHQSELGRAAGRTARPAVCDKIVRPREGHGDCNAPGVAGAARCDSQAGGRG